MNDNVVEINNNGGVIEFRDINQNITLDNLNRNLDSLNREWISHYKKNKNSIILTLLSNQEKILDISKQNLFFKNTFFRNEKIYFEDIYVPLNIQRDRHIRSLQNNQPVSSNSYTVNDDFLVEKIIKNNRVC